MRTLWLLCRVALLALFVFQGPIAELVGRCDDACETASHEDEKKCHCPSSCACGCLALPQADAPRTERAHDVYLGAFVFLDPPPLHELVPVDLVDPRLKVPKRVG